MPRWRRRNWDHATLRTAMAHILLLDDSEIAGQAMRGILNHGHHRCMVAAEVEAAWKLLRELVKVDPVIMDLRLREGPGGLHFLERLQSDCFLKHLPVVVYTKVEDHAVARQALALKIQNVLIKPYNEDLINAEIQKAFLSGAAQNAGFWGVVDLLQELSGKQ